MSSDEKLSGLRILVVEDEPMIAWALADGLQRLGCEVVGPAFDTVQAVELSREQGVNGAVLDVNLGRDKVFPVADSLARRHIPFCFVTGYDTAELRPEDLRWPILQKSVDLEDIAQIAQHWRAN